MAAHAKKADTDMAELVGGWIAAATAGQWRVRVSDVYQAGDVMARMMGRRSVEIAAAKRLRALGWRRVRYMDGDRAYWYVSPRLPRAAE